MKAGLERRGLQGLLAAWTALAAIAAFASAEVVARPAPAPSAEPAAPEFAAAAPTTSPAPATDAPAEADADAGRTAQRTLTVIGNELYAALLEEKSPDVVANLLREALTRAGRACDQLRDFQVYRYGSGYRTLKVKCINQPLYAVTVGSQKGVQISGGDGSIRPFDTLDGRIETVFGVRAEQYFNAHKKGINNSVPEQVPVPASAVQGGEVDIAAPGDESGLPSWAPIVAINLVILGIFGLALLKVLRDRRDDGAERYSSDEKDALIEEAEEILPGVYRHPDGLFIARGRNGKRRLFRILLFAYFYRQFGVKIFEIR